MVLAYHVIFCTYGFWLPNDPRGSWSDFVGSWELLRFGHATARNDRRSVAHTSHDCQSRQAAKSALKYPIVRLTAAQTQSVAAGFANYLARSGIIVWACSILPQHVHLAIARHRFDVEHIVNQLKGHATRQLTADHLHPLANFTPRPNCWARGQWKVFLNTPADIQRSIRYVQDNPAKEGMPAQKWEMVTQYRL